MKKLFVLLTLVCAVSLFAGNKSKQPVVTTGTLFQEMVDLEKLADYPDPPYRMVQYSSYDRRSDLPGGPEWHANNDGFGGEPIPSFEEVLKEPNDEGVGEYLIADVKGPGALVRLWTAWIEGNVRLYVDDMKKPLFEGTADEFFRRPYSGYPEFKLIDTERFKKTVYQQDASYAPIPFARRLRLEWIGNRADIHFYHVQFRLYPQKTKVVSFSPGDIKKYADIIDQTTQILAEPGKSVDTESRKHLQSFETELAPSDEKTVVHLEGEQAIKELTLKLSAADMDKALRQTLLSIHCDGYPWGQVESPVGDFFGAAPGVNPYQSLPFEVRADGTMICRFVMPFQDSLDITLKNWGDQEVSVTGSVVPADFSWSDRSMYFRAKWRVSNDLIAPNEEVFDLPFLIARGEGLYVGTTSYLMNPSDVPTPYGNWWGEGDEKIFVDDDFMPSLFGTGSEDYYNYSWSIPDIFYHPYCGQPRDDGPGNRGFVTNFRWHILDPIPFRHNINFYMELNSHEVTPGFSYARIGYHYARPGIIDDSEPIMPNDLQIPELPETWTPAAKKGSANSVFYQAEEVIADRSGTHFVEGRQWASAGKLVWTPKKTGEQKDFTFPVEVSGKKRIYLTASLTPSSGKVRMLLDGEVLSFRDGNDVIDLHRPHRVLSRNFLLKTAEFSEGNHTLTIEYLGSAHNDSEPEIGIDMIWVQSINY